MKLTVWTYEGPPHVGAMRVATAMKGLHYILHAPQGDTYADLLFTMIERRGERPPVTYTTFQARDLGEDTANLFKSACQEAVERFKPGYYSEHPVQQSSFRMTLGLATLGVDIPVIPLELPSYKEKRILELMTFYQIVKKLAKKSEKQSEPIAIPGPTSLGFWHRVDVKEVSELLSRLCIKVNVVAPLGATPSDIQKLGDAHFNVLLYPESGESAARWLEQEYEQPYTKTVPIGVGATKSFINEVKEIIGSNETNVGDENLRFDWWSKSVDSTYFTGKRVFIFGDATHVKCAAKIAKDEMAFEVVGMGCYNREFARSVRAQGRDLDIPVLISDDYLEVEKLIEELQPELILGTQMERHIGKRLGIPCAVISAPFHVQDHPARYSPQMGWEGSNVVFDTWVHPLVMGLEEHLLHMFREDFEFNDQAGPSHLSSHGNVKSENESDISNGESKINESEGEVAWLNDAEAELKKIPFFVRGKARRNTEKFALEKGLTQISSETLYEAKAHYAR